MTGLFQTLIDFLSFLLYPIYSVLCGIVNYVWGCLYNVLYFVVWLGCQLVSGFCVAFCWIIDKMFLLSIIGIKAILGAAGMFAQAYGIGSTANIQIFVRSLLSYGAYGVSWVQNFIDFAVVVTPLVFYISFITCWTAYKFIKSWIPTIGS